LCNRVHYAISQNESYCILDWLCVGSQDRKNRRSILAVVSQRTIHVLDQTHELVPIDHHNFYRNIRTQI
jgi:hypothetical protein